MTQVQNFVIEGKSATDAGIANPGIGIDDGLDASDQHFDFDFAVADILFAKIGPRGDEALLDKITGKLGDNTLDQCCVDAVTQKRLGQLTGLLRAQHRAGRNRNGFEQNAVVSIRARHRSCIKQGQCQQASLRFRTRRKRKCG